MVRIASTLFLALSFVATGICTPVKRTVEQIQTDIASISTQVTSLDNAITAFPATGGTLLNALAIHSSSGSLISSLQTATGDVIATGPVNEVDGRAILSAVEAFAPTIIHALEGIVVKKPAFQALPIGGIPALVLQDLKDLQTNAAEFANALIDISPESLKDEATALRDSILDAFAVAITAYEQ